jgi:hypothetical protein
MLQINASIAKHQNRFWCSYQTKSLRHYNAECFLTELNPELEPISEKRLIPENHNTAFEGIRLFSFEDKLLAFYHYLPFQENIGWKIKYGVGYGEVDIVTGLIRNQVSLRNLSKRTHEKNWSPYSWNGALYMVTDFEPFLRVIKIGQANINDIHEEVFIAAEKTKRWEFGELMGGTPLISNPADNDGWLYGFAHSFKLNEQGFKRYYYYTAVRYHHQNRCFEYHMLPLPYNDEEPDEEYESLWRQSNGRHRKVIFPIGIAHHNDGVLVSFGKDDVISYTEPFSWESIKAYFN